LKFSLANITLIAYLAATVIYFLHLASQRRKIAQIGLVVVLAGAAFNIAAIIHRWIVAGYPPFSNMYESLLLMACAIAISYAVFQIISKIEILGGLVMMLAVLSLGYASFVAGDDIRPLVPALQSNWLTIHVITYFISYGALSLSFVTALAYLIKRKPAPVEGSEGQPKPGTKLAELTYQSIKFAFPFLTIGLITGAVWAKTAWGDYWSWDPKETWALVTWLVYLNFLHLKYSLPGLAKTFGWKKESLPTISCSFAVAGFVAMLFTYFGVNYLLAGLHSYVN
jgi:cytochrome c-type biogenesis protein CcsB